MGKGDCGWRDIEGREREVEGLYTHGGWVYTSMLAGLDAFVKRRLRRARGGCVTHWRGAGWA